MEVVEIDRGGDMSTVWRPPFNKVTGEVGLPTPINPLALAFPGEGFTPYTGELGIKVTQRAPLGGR